MIKRPLSTPRFGLRVILGLGAALILLSMLALPLWPSVGYRRAVNGLHDELAASTPESAEVIAAYVDRCWAGSAPASIRVLRPVNGAELADMQGDYIRELQQLGFTAESVGSAPVQSRERDDALDGDIVRFLVDDSTKTLTVVADTYDADSVVCLPL